MIPLPETSSACSSMSCLIVFHILRLTNTLNLLKRCKRPVNQNCKTAFPSLLQRVFNVDAYPHPIQMNSKSHFQCPCRLVCRPNRSTGSNVT